MQSARGQIAKTLNVHGWNSVVVSGGNKSGDKEAVFVVPADQAGPVGHGWVVGLLKHGAQFVSGNLD